MEGWLGLPGGSQLRLKAGRNAPRGTAQGNLVTNARWSDFWLNEGWTVFLERKIVGRLQVG